MFSMRINASLYTKTVWSPGFSRPIVQIPSICTRGNRQSSPGSQGHYDAHWDIIWTCNKRTGDPVSQKRIVANERLANKSQTLSSAENNEAVVV